MSWFPLVLAFYLLGFALPAPAAVHPVKLEKGTDTPQCIQCHEDRSKGKHVHPAVDMGCLTCHVIRNTADTTRVNLKNARVATLCFQCHGDKEPKGNAFLVHKPAAQDCLKCHDPHTSENDALLLKTTSGDKTENLCLSCHRQGLNVPEKGSRHAALDMGCATCHVTHKTGKAGQQEFDFHLTKAAPALCIDCHDVKDANLVKAHQGQPFAGAVCTSCHDPHDSAAPKLMQKFVHAPFGDKSCDTCHQPAKDGKVVLTQSDSRALCVACHDEQAKAIDAAKVAHPGAQGECVQCHSPHAGRFPRFLRPNPVAACESCHTKQAEIHQTQKVLHKPAFQDSCSICHTPHGGQREHLLRAETNQLCLTCHGAAAKATKVEGSTDVTLFDGAVRLPGDYLDQVRVLPLDDKGRGHPQDRHPVGGVLDPSDPQKTRTITCVRCHEPHGGGRALLVTGKSGSGSLCSQCHANLRGPGAAPTQTPAVLRDDRKRKGK